MRRRIQQHETMIIPSSIDSGILNTIALPTGERTADFRLARYGEHPVTIGGRRYIQVVDEQSADMLVANFNAPFEKLRQIFNSLRRGRPASGIEIFEGHVDDAEWAATHRATVRELRAIGRIKRLEKRTDGVWAHAVFNSTGVGLLEGDAPHYDEHSPHWNVLEAKELGPDKLRPALLISTALTNHPNIPGNTIVLNSRVIVDDVEEEDATPEPEPESESTPAPDPDPSPNPEPEEMKLTAATLALLGLAENPTQEQIESSIASKLQAPEQAANTAKALKKAAIDRLLNDAVTSGKITEAARPQWQTKLDAAQDATALNTAADELATQKALNTQSVTDGLDKSKGVTTPAAPLSLNDRVTSVMNTMGVTRDRAFDIIAAQDKAATAAH